MAATQHLDLKEIGYGSDKNGLVWGYRFEPGNPPQPIGCDAAVGGIPLSQHRQGFALVVGALTVITGVLAYLFLVRRRD
jgi:hypothetical protein